MAIAPAHFDPLTGLPSRAGVQDALAAAVEAARSEREWVAVVHVDVDGFRAVNDLRGSDEGDAVLAAVAERLVTVGGEHTPVGRLGSDDFALVARGGEGTAMALADRVLRAVRQPLVVGERRHRLTASAGIACARGGAAASRTLLRDAGAALARAKRCGGDRVHVFDAQLRRDLAGRAALEQDLRRGVDAGELVLHYQPVCSLWDDGPLWLEALLRWRHPTRGVLPAGAFLGAAESAGVGRRIDDFVLRRACAQIATWLERHGADAPRVSVNLSPVAIAEPDMVDRLTGALAHVGAPADMLVVELTESAALEAGGDGADAATALARLGVHVVLDDFGAGHSSLTWLRHAPFGGLKLDRSLVAHIDGDPVDRAIVETLVTLGAKLALDVVAEGVERASQVAVLRDMGCTAAQGFLLGRPASAEIAAALFAGLPGSPERALDERVIPLRPRGRAAALRRRRHADH